jgi:type IV pilus assembly protein PilM
VDHNRVVSLDVEYAHLQEGPIGRRADEHGQIVVQDDPPHCVAYRVPYVCVGDAMPPRWIADPHADNIACLSGVIGGGSTNPPTHAPQWTNGQAPKLPLQGKRRKADDRSVSRRARNLPSKMPGFPKPNLNLSFRRSSGGADLVGLDIQPGYVAAVQADVNGSIVLRHASGAPLPADTIREGEVLDDGLLADTLREVFRDERLGKRVRIGVANQRTVLRVLELPPVTDRKELDAAVRFQAEDQIPMPLSNAVLDYQSLGEIDTPNGMRQRVIVVAAQRDMVEKLLSAVRDAGLRPEGVDLSAFALIRSLYRSGAESQGRVLYLNVGGLTNMAIAEGLVCRFTRVVGGGLEAMAADVAERRGIPLVEARALLAALDLRPAEPVEVAPEPEPEPPAAVAEEDVAAEEDGEDDEPLVDFHEGFGTPPEPEAVETWALAQDPRAEAPAEAEPEGDVEEHEAVPAPAAATASDAQPEPVAGPVDEDVRLVLENGIREIVGDVRNSLDFHRSQDGGGDVTSVVLSGPALQIPGFADLLEADLGLAVRRQSVQLADQGALGGLSADHLTIAAGLAAEEVHS